MGPNLFDALCYNLHIRSGKSRIVVIGDENALAAHYIVGCQLPAQFRILYRLFQMIKRYLLIERHQLGIAETDEEDLPQDVDPRPQQPLGNWKLLVDRPLSL